MIESFRRFRVIACGLALLAFGATAFGGTVSLKAVKKNGGDVTPTNVIDAGPGDTIEAEIFISGWESDRPGSILFSYDIIVDGPSSYVVNGVNMVLPTGYDIPPVCLCEGNVDCEACAITPDCRPALSGFCTQTCQIDAHCSDLVDFPRCSQVGQFCVGENHDPEAFNLIDVSREDFCHADFQNLGTAGLLGLNINYGSTTFGGGPLDTGQECYTGTLSLDLLPEACGVIVIQLPGAPEKGSCIDGHACLRLQAPGDPGAFEFPPTTEPLTINTGLACADPVKLVSTEPPDCTTDNRMPHAPDSRQPAFWFNETFDFIMEFSTEPDGGFQQEDFLATQNPGAPGTPGIDAFSADGTTVTISVNRPPVGGRWLCIEYAGAVADGQNNTACWARLPGDVDGDLETNAADLAALIDVVQGAPADLLHCDMDRSDMCAAPDLVGWIDVANGAGELPPGLGRTLPECPTAAP